MINKKTGLIALLAGFGVGQLSAGTLTNYAVGDVLVCLRKGGNDMVVDVGPLSTLTNALPNQRIPIGQYTGPQLNAVGIDAMNWSAFAWLGDDTLFVSKARTFLDTQSSPWQAKSVSAQHGTALRMASIPPGALDQFTLLVYPLSTPSAVLEEDVSSGNPNYTHGVSYHEALAGAYGANFNGTFVGNPENTTTANFSSSGSVVRSDFYKLIPTSGFAFGTLLGYFELSAGGTMTYVAYPSAPAVMKSVARAGNSTTLTYTTGLYGTYTLRGTNSLLSGAAIIDWPAITTLTSGDSATHSITFSDTDDIKFYAITAQ